MPDQVATKKSVHDALLAGVELPFRATYYPLGFPLEVSTNSESVLEAASQSWSECSQEFEEPPVTVSLGVAESGGAQLPPRPKFRSRGHLLSIVSNAENFMMCDFNRGCAFGWVTRRVISHLGFLRRHFLEAASLSTIGQRYLAPIHGALVARNGRGILLCGEQFAGKSTLSYACARAGWTLVSDDGTFLVRNRTDRYAVGNPHTINLRGEAKQLFPELISRPITTRPGGKVGMEMFTRDLAIATASGCMIEHAVFLNRSLNRNSGGIPRIERYSREDALESFESVSFYGEPQVRAAQRAAYQRMLGAGMWELHYSDFEDAVLCLDQLATRGG